MLLNKYNDKRNFDITSEPSGVDKHALLKSGKGGSRYVIHKHQASHLHYDLRLEWDGVLKSWAVPKGPSLDPSEKRLAVQVEEHPLEYADFEGVIPEGEYGAGQVIVWDSGTFETVSDGDTFGEMLLHGALKLVIHGRKLQGGFHLIRTKWGGRKNNWLLIKGKDAQARSGSEITVEQPRSVLSGRDVDFLVVKA